MRNIFIVNATQVVISDAHPEGLFSVIAGYPKNFDSRSYNATEQNPDGNTDAALRAAKAEYFSRLSANYAGSETRVMATVTLEQANGQQILRDSIGGFPTVPAPQPEPEPPQPEETEPTE